MTEMCLRKTLCNIVSECFHEQSGFFPPDVLIQKVFCYHEDVMVHIFLAILEQLTMDRQFLLVQILNYQ